MLIVLPVLAWIFLFLLVYQHHCWRSSVLLAAIFWGTIVTAIVEVLSLFSIINIWSISLAWLGVDCILAAYYSSKIARRNPKPLSVELQLPFYSIALLIGVALIAIALGIIALVVPPNNWDTMTYHMPRVVHWMQNQNVSHYPTNYLPQLYQSPWSEFTIMNFQILSGGDRFANLVQWFGMIGSLVGVSLIAKKLGSQSFGQVLSVVFAATLPMGIMQASNAKNDYAVAFWLVCFVCFVLETLEDRINIKNCGKISISLGLALLTKGTAYFYALPFCLWLGIEIIISHRSRFWRSAISLSTPVILINLGHYLRNIALFGTPIFSPPEYRIEYFSFSTFVSNVVKNMALHMPIPLDTINNSTIEKLIIGLHSTVLGVDINDPRITSPGVQFGLTHITPNFEDSAPNPFHFYLIVLAVGVFCIWQKPRDRPQLIKYLIFLLLALFAFCFLVKWQPWQSRLHISIFVLFAAFVGAVFEQALSKRLSIYFAIALIAISPFWVFFNDSKPVIAKKNIFNTSRTEQYFARRFTLMDDYIESTRFVKSQNCSQVGLIVPADNWEYPLWILLKQNNRQPMQIQQIHINNVSKVKQKQFNYDTFSPCAILDLGTLSTPTVQTEFGRYEQAWTGTSMAQSLSGQMLRVYMRKKTAN